MNSRNGELVLPPVEGPTGARWAQAFSTDGGSAWETNWVAEFSREG